MARFDYTEIVKKMSEIGETARLTFHLVQTVLEPRDDPGLVLAIRHGGPYRFLHQQYPIDALPADRQKKCARLAGGKIDRAWEMGQLTSLESAEPAKELYPGGIVCGQWAYGISGRAGLDDHCLAVSYAVTAGHISKNEAYRLYIPDEHRKRFDKIFTALF